MIYAMVMISMGMTMIYAGEDTDLKILFAIGLLLYFAGILIGDMVEKRYNKKIPGFMFQHIALWEFQQIVDNMELTNGKGNTL